MNKKKTQMGSEMVMESFIMLIINTPNKKMFFQSTRRWLIEESLFEI